jgi:hypothetical protein
MGSVKNSAVLAVRLLTVCRLAFEIREILPMFRTDFKWFGRQCDFRAVPGLQFIKHSTCLGGKRDLNGPARRKWIPPVSLEEKRHCGKPFYQATQDISKSAYVNSSTFFIRIQMSASSFSPPPATSLVAQPS